MGSAGVRVLALTLVLAVTGAACGDDGERTPASANTCEELVDQAAELTEQIVADLRDKSSADLEPGTVDEPFPELTRPFAAFEARSAQLGCDRGELRRLACNAYQGIEATGPATEEFLAAVDAVCS